MAPVDAAMNAENRIQRLQGELNDLAATLAQPARWKGRDPGIVAGEMLDVLMNVLRLDVAGVRLDPPLGGYPRLEDWRPSLPDGSWFGPALEGAWPAEESAAVTMESVSPDGMPLRVVVDRQSLLGAALRVVMGSRRADFPTETERFLLRVVVVQASFAIEATVVAGREQSQRGAADEGGAEVEDARRRAKEPTPAHAEVDAALRDALEARDRARTAAEAAHQYLQELFLAAADLADAKLLQDISGQLIHEQDVVGLYEKILDAAVAITRSDFASMQMLDPWRGKGGVLRLLAYRGFTSEAARFWEWVPAGSACTCGVALATGQRVVVPDVERCDSLVGTEDLAMYRKAGIRAAQSTPLLSRGGVVVGMISTHWRDPHPPSERDLRLLDVVARQAADLVERQQAEDVRTTLLAQTREAVRARDELIALVSHDLKNPLAAIHGWAQFLQRGLARPDPPDREKLRDGLANVELASLKMQRLVDELLDHARVQAGERLGLDRRPTDLVALVRRIVAEQQQTTTRHRIRLDLGDSALVGRWDAPRLERVIENLLTNAVKYSPSGGDVTVTLARETHGSGDQATLVVRDQGIGIPAADLPRVFERFYRASNVVGLAAGTGLGLTGVRQIVEQHGGTIEAASTEGQGSTFTVRLPLSNARPVDAEP